MTSSLALSPATTASTATTAPSARLPALRSDRLALPLLFAWFGIVMGSWAGRIPALRDGIGASHAQLSLVLLCGGLGAVLSFPLTGLLLARLGARRSALASGAALLGVLLAIGTAPGMAMLMAAVLLLGVCASVFDVAMNALATTYETALGRPALARLHAWGCAGGLGGTALGSAMGALQVTPALHFALVAAPAALVLWLAYRCCAALPGSAAPEQRRLALPRGPLALLGALGFLGAIAEGGLADWSGIFMKDHFQVGDGVAPLALAACSVMMLLVRLVGDRAKQRFGARRLLMAGAATAAAGIALAVLAPAAPLALAGFAVTGTGLALVFPFVFSAAGREGPLALAGVATMTYCGTLSGPPLLGGVAQLFGMQAAIGFIGVLALGIALLAGRSALLRA